MNKLASILKFDDRTNKYACFLNSYPLDLKFDNKTYSTVANYFYSKMYENVDELFSEELRQASIKEIKSLADSRKREVKDEWCCRRLNILYEALRQKFEKRPDFKKILLSTDDYYLLYDNSDRFFGCGKDGNGCNILGKVLMEVRNALKYQNIGE
jgi:ribA/ribD-fused uncharacterized protein